MNSLKAALGVMGRLTAFKAKGITIIEKLLSEFIDRGVNIRQFGAVCNANYKNSGNNMWYEDAAFTIPATDDSDAIQSAIDATPKGSRVHIPGSCMISKQLVITKPIELYGNFGRDKSANQVYGSRLVYAKDVNQEAMESMILINASSVKLRGIALKGKGASFAD